MSPNLELMIEAATVYEEIFVPALFREWAPRVADAAGIRPGDRALDVACGTGVLAREVAARTGDGGSVAGLDLDPGMIAVAARHAPYIVWRQGEAEALPYPDASFDVVVSQFGLMIFRDRRAALREMVRVLRRGGRLALAVWGALDDAPAYAAEVAILERVGGRPAADALRAPFALGDLADLSRLLDETGLDSAEVHARSGYARFPSIRGMVEADINGWLPVMGIRLADHQVSRILEEAERALAPFLTPEGTVEFVIPAHIVTWEKPA